MELEGNFWPDLFPCCIFLFFFFRSSFSCNMNIKIGFLIEYNCMQKCVECILAIIENDSFQSRGVGIFERRRFLLLLCI